MGPNMEDYFTIKPLNGLLNKGPFAKFLFDVLDNQGEFIEELFFTLHRYFTK